MLKYNTVAQRPSEFKRNTKIKIQIAQSSTELCIYLCAVLTGSGKHFTQSVSKPARSFTLVFLRLGLINVVGAYLLHLSACYTGGKAWLLYYGFGHVVVSSAVGMQIERVPTFRDCTSL